MSSPVNGREWMWPLVGAVIGGIYAALVWRYQWSMVTLVGGVGILVFAVLYYLRPSNWYRRMAAGAFGLSALSGVSVKILAWIRTGSADGRASYEVSAASTATGLGLLAVGLVLVALDFKQNNRRTPGDKQKAHIGAASVEGKNVRFEGNEIESAAQSALIGADTLKATEDVTFSNNKIKAKNDEQ